MVIINELRITPDGKNLIVEATVENLRYYKQVYIDSVVIDTQDTFSANGPSSNPVYTTSFEYTHDNISTREDCSPVVVQGGNCECGDVYTSQKHGRKNIRLILSAKDLGRATLDNDIFFVYIIATGVPEPYTPCGMDNSTVMGIAYNLRPLYNLGMGYIRELADNCSMPKNFIDYILRFKAFELSLRTGNYTLAIDYWKRFFKNKTSSISKPKGCGCHGSY